MLPAQPEILLNSHLALVPGLCSMSLHLVAHHRWKSAHLVVPKAPEGGPVQRRQPESKWVQLKAPTDLTLSMLVLPVCILVALRRSGLVAHILQAPPQTCI